MARSRASMILKIDSDLLVENSPGRSLRLRPMHPSFKVSAVIHDEFPPTLYFVTKLFVKDSQRRQHFLGLGMVL